MKGFGVIKTPKTGWIEKKKPSLKGNDAILRPIALAPCSSDTHSAHGGAGVKENLILGHEAVAEVVEVSSEIKRFKKGDVVVVPCVTPDWNEVGLQDRNINNAHDSRFMGSFKFLNSKDGSFAEFFHVNNADANLVHLPKNVTVDQALMTCDMMSTGFYGVENARVKFGDNVVVIGIGPVGLMAVAGAKLQGAGHIIGVGTRPNCVELAKKYGASEIINYKEGPVDEQVKELFPNGIDSVIIAGGNANSINQALRMVKPNGFISNVNYFDSKDTISFPTLEWGLGMGDISIVGGFCPGGAKRIERLLNMIANKRVDPSLLLNKSYDGFEKIEDAFNIMHEKPRDLIKPVVHIKW
ncbi:zinc-binding dehydrogenase [Anaerococcus porci]|uniref:zinc-binding dehydrogenase n=1 Tax=Anaerococcus porci TaxID=2652269 RepID=UPI002A74E4D9|nr:zinc-binding dehydrogenase [Anaerococcus porci]MDY3006124.1 zinc-binding dehydrogenase [Anaerococcus porci]